MPRPPVIVSLQIADRQASYAFERARRAGAAVVTVPGRQPWGYAGTFADPDGHLWMITSPATAR